MGSVTGQVGWCARRLFLVDEDPAQLGVRLGRAGEVAAHDGQLGGAVGGQRPLFFGRGELPRFGGQPSWVIGAGRQLFGQGGHLLAVAGRVGGDDLVDQAGSQG
jgi:hypothetical protein